MSPAVASLAAQSISPRTTSGRADSICPNLPLEPCSCGSERISWDIFINMDCLGVLAQVIKARETAGAVTLERSFAGMFPVDNVSFPMIMTALRSLLTEYVSPNVHCE